MSDCIEISACDPHFALKIRVFLDSQEVTNQSFWARVPAEPGVEGDGEVWGYVQPLTKTVDGGLATWRKAGRVFWVWRAGHAQS